MTINLSHNNLKKFYVDNLERENSSKENAPTIDNSRQAEVTQNAGNSGSSEQSDLLQANALLSSKEANLGQSLLNETDVGLHRNTQIHLLYQV